MPTTHLRKVRSFVRRPGRITSGQQRALERLMPNYGIAIQNTPVDLDEVFARRAPRVLEIGFGDGEALLSAAANHPEIDYLGVEVHEPGIGHLLILLERARIANVRVVRRDAVEVLGTMLGEASLDAVNLFFPDPWPKKRHHKRRIVQDGFVADIGRVLKPGGILHVATDWEDYASHCREVLARSMSFAPVELDDLAGDRLAFRPPSKFERRGRRLGHDVVDLGYRRK
jgi:tRNA (guanine-N7-)-methyltransferase